jgi:plasmid stability protein
MANVTINLSDEQLREVRVEAARAGKSVSKFLADMIERNIVKQLPNQASTREAQREALEKILSGPKWSVMRDGRMPTADERNER